MEETPAVPHRHAPHSAHGWIRDLAACLFLVALVVLFYWRVLTPKAIDRGSLTPGDLTDQFYAFARAEARQLVEGRLPLWEPCANSGHPFLADVQAAVFYPPSLLTALLIAWFGGSLVALELEVVAHFCLGAIWTYAFARRVAGHRGGALLAACTFTFGGYLTGYPPLQLAILKTDVWLPLVLLGLEAGASRLEAGTRHAWVPFVGAGLAFGVAILAGHPQSAMYIGYAAIAYVLFRLWAPAHRRRLPGVLALFLLAALGLSAAQWLPSWEYMRLSSRAGMSYAEASTGLSLPDLLQLVLPSASPLYAGVAPLLLALLAAAVARSRAVLFWTGLGLGALLLSLGGNLFFYPVFYLLAPGLGLFRSQERAVFLASFALAILAGYGLAGLLRGPAPRWLPKPVGVLAAGALGLAAMAYAGWVAGGQVIPSPFWWFLQQGVYLFLLLTGAGVLAFWRSRGGSGHGMVVAVLALVLLDLFTANANRNLDRRPPEEITRPSPLIAAMQADPSTFRVFNEGQLAGGYGCLFDLEDTGGASPLRLERYRRLSTEAPKEFVWQLLNVKYVVTWSSTLQAPSEIIASEARGDQTTYLHRLTTVSPRAWVVHEAEIIPDDEQAIARLSDWRFSPFRAAILPAPLKAPLGAVGVDISPSTVQWVRREDSRLELEVNLPAGGLLVLSEVYYPGWKARVDGLPVETLRADLALRAIPVPAGSHKVEMIYRPWTVPAGIAISLLSMMGAGLAALWVWRHRA